MAQKGEFHQRLTRVKIFPKKKLVLDVIQDENRTEKNRKRRVKARTSRRLMIRVFAQIGVRREPRKSIRQL